MPFINFGVLLAIVLALTPCFSLAANTTASSNGLMVGAARVDITPTPNSLWLPLNIYDNERLYVRAIVFNNDGVYGAFISCELAFIKDPIYKAANALVAAYLNTTTSNVIVSITHAHSAGPAGVTTANQYGNAALSTYPSVAEAALAAVEKALLVMRPAKVGYNTGSAYHNVNRDALNPLTGRWTQASNTSGPVDREVQVLTFLSTDATPEPLAAWTSYAMHPVQSYLSEYTTGD
ncbi:hypothetical protein GLAREA_07897 [Glarea lozoyensis ATCC 20868]|uniref:Neutral/alkaline non-lysosomal ceramidase N-terminal domain-containing protein n=1 Tax=Glarea lozoyensis (strain ATCC 20868 / MF5171) TaxID=1116229 RepID=S3E2V6_GLAL2|nr:uncharacterized protein GLAREA_07897 [Glarea lozoyensis ATCC 20868]EPE32763.1 hypothetical protein GLAREA_07897 [Glarea lozoyensis ATCC 20868]